MSRAFFIKRIAATEAQILAYEDAVTAITVGGMQSYTIDTGQTVQTVTKLNLKALQTTLDTLYNRLTTLNARVYGTGVHTSGPTW